jgi:hypothetical protein
MSDASLTTRLLSNPHKAHIANNPQISATIFELSKNSRFTQNQRERQVKLDKRIQEIREIERKNPWGRREKEYVDKLEKSIEAQRDITQVVVHVNTTISLAPLQH